jgi:hypothetical protein
MRRAHIGVCLGLVIGVVAAGYGRDLDTGEQASNVEGGGYLIRNASLVLTMDPNLGDGGMLGKLEDADVLIIGDHIAAVGDLSARTKIFLYVKILSTLTDSPPNLFTTLINKKDMLTGAISSKFKPRNSQLTL